MNFKKILIFILLASVLISSFIVPSYALDYTTSIAILPTGYPSPSYFSVPAYIGEAWDTLISENDTTLAAHLDIYQGYVFFKDQFLVDRFGNPVCYEDEIESSDVATYTVYDFDDICTIEGDTVVFDDIVGSMTFGDLQVINSYITSNNFVFSLYGYNSNYILLNSKLLQTSSGTTLTVTDGVDPNAEYMLVELECTHQYNTAEIIEYSTCISQGSQKYVCRFCNAEKIEALPIDEYNHKWRAVAYEDSTCSSTGYVSNVCELCGDTDWVVLDMLEHSYSEATCTDPSECKLCGKLKSSALGHDLDLLGRCKRDGCDFKQVKAWVDSAGQSVGDWWNDEVVSGAKNVGTTIKETVVEYIVEPGKTVIEYITGNGDSNISLFDGFKNFFKALIAIVGFVVLIAVVYFVTKIVLNVVQIKNSKSKRRKRRRRKKK